MQGGKIVELNTYCDRLKADLTRWKARTYDLIQEADNMPPSNRERLSASLKQLHGIVANIEKEIKRLETECPVEWEAEREAMKQKFKELNEKSDELWKDLSPDDF
jgi:predicted nuclease with TOPRIM domain